MKKVMVKVLVTSAVMISILIAAVVLMSKGKTSNRETNELDLLTESVDKQEINEGGSKHVSIGKNQTVMQFSHGNVKDIYNVKKSKAIAKKIDKLKKQTRYTFDNPLFIWNAYGTNKLSLYYYFRSEESTYVKYTIQVDDDKIPDFTRTLNTHTEGNLTRVHEYLLTGFVPGYQNYLVLRQYNAKGKLLKKQYFDFYVDKLGDGVKTKLGYEDGKSTSSISNGLFAVCGYHAGEKNIPKAIPFYDNSGIVRSVIPIENDRTDKIEILTDSMIYSISNQAFAQVSSLGQVMNVYPLGQYRLHHDFVYNGYGQLWCLATKKNAQSICDYVISVDVKNGKVIELVDCGALFPKLKKQAAKANKTRPLNWINLNSIVRIDSSDIIVSSRELSSIIRINHVTSGYPKIGYIISDNSIWKKTNNKKYLLLKGAYLDEKWYNLDSGTEKLGEDIHNFSCQLGQNSVSFEQGKGLSEGQYYLTMLNNNYAYSTMVPGVKWSKFTNAGSKHRVASNSYYYEYLVDEKAGYFGLKRSYGLPYTAQGGNVFWNGTNTIANSMGEKVFGEYDSTGKLIREFSLKAYRVYKYDMKSIWYY